VTGTRARCDHQPDMTILAGRYASQVRTPAENGHWMPGFRWRLSLVLSTWEVRIQSGKIASATPNHASQRSEDRIHNVSASATNV
jgi:hypothetical protein